MDTQVGFNWSLENLSMDQKQAVQAAVDSVDAIFSEEVQKANERARIAIEKAAKKMQAAKARIYGPYKI